MSALLVLAIVATVVALVLLALTFRTRRQIEGGEAVDRGARETLSQPVRILIFGHCARFGGRASGRMECQVAGPAWVDAPRWRRKQRRASFADGTGNRRHSELAGLARHHPPGEAHETSLIGADGERRTLALRHWPMALADDSGTDSGSYWLLVNDVTQREETRTLLRLARQTYQSIRRRS